MPPRHPPEEWKVTKQDHPGSHPKEIKNEPDWSSTGHEHYIGYKNSQGRRPGHVAGDEHENEMYINEAWNEFQKTKRKVKEGKLVNWQEAIKTQKDLSLHHPEGRPHGWRYVLDYTEEEIKNQQDWPINVKKREKECQQQEEEEEKKQKEQEQDEKQQPNGTEEDDEDKSKKNGQVDGSSDQQDEQPQAGQQQDEQQQDDGSEDEKLRDRYTPQEIACLRAIEHEKDYMANLKTNDGTGRSNVANRTDIAIDEADQFTPDNWIPRSPELIRLSGKHPLNAEAPISRLFDSGFITPNELFYVRSHGAVPRLLWEYHRLEITLGEKKRCFSINEIKWDFDAINIPVFMGCDNGRRKELNLIKRTKGFNWGPGAVGCAYWKGPLLRNVLMAAGVPERRPDQDRKRYFVHLQGADNPGAANYETSVAFDYIMDPTNDVILAYEMNDVPLPPDHGYPIRVIIPGYVGGRQVKWLQKIWINDKENDSYYHIWDNRAVPSFVTETESEFAMAMFHHPNTALYEQYLNSVITAPQQGETIALKDVQKDKQYRVKGFAFNGLGDEIKRIEVTLDEGKTWLYCIRTFPEAPIRHGTKFWTWCFWYVDVDIGVLVAAPSIRVRAWDVKMVTQPEHPTWNILGSMNNVQYAVKPELVNDATPHIHFRHPVEPANMDEGWMKESAENQIADAGKKTDAPNKQFTREEVEKHDKNDDCWIIVDNMVYDATSVLDWHPGGAAPIMMHAGTVHYETTEEFSSLHDEYAYQKLNECILGVLTDKAKKHVEKTKESKDDPGAKLPEDQALQKHRWVPATLTERQWLTHDTAEYKFRLPDKASYLGLGTCQHIEFGFHLRDRMLIRPYTPTKPIFPRDTGVDDVKDKELFDGSGIFQLTVKTYFPDEEQPGGALSNILAAMPIGEEVEMRGPTGDVTYHGDGKFSILGQDKQFKRVSLVLGGTGLTPGYSLIARICLNPNDPTELRVVDANNSEADILLQNDLDHLQQVSKGKLKIAHVLSQPSEEWKGLKGFVNTEIMRAHLFPPKRDEEGNEENLVLLCGPPAMIQKAVVPGLEEWGYDHDRNMFGL